MREHSISRRTVLKAAGALGSVTTLAVPVAIPPNAKAADSADADLLRLGSERERAGVLLNAEQERNGDVSAKWEVEYARWRAENPTAPFDDFISHPATITHDAAISREEIFLNAMDKAAEQIRELSAKTLAGLAVKARLAQDEFNDILAISRTIVVEDWKIEHVLSFFREVERMVEASHA